MSAPLQDDFNRHMQSTLAEGEATASLNLLDSAGRMCHFRCLSSPFSREEPASILTICNQISDLSRGLVPTLNHRARLHRRNQFLTALNSVTSQMMNHLPLDDLLQKICDLVLELTGADSSFFHLVEEGEDVLVLTTVAGRYVADKGARLSPGQGLAGKAWVSAEVEYTDNYQSVQNRLTHLKDISQAGAMPVIIKGAVVGVIGLMSSTRKESIAEQLDLLRQFSHLCSIAFENSRLLEEHKLELLRSRTISDLSNAVYESKNQFDVLRDTAHAIMRGFNSINVDMWELDGNSLGKLLGAWYLRDEQAFSCDAESESLKRETAQAWLTQFSLSQGDATTDSDDASNMLDDVLTHEDGGVSVFLPMVVDNTTLGLIHVQRARDRRKFQHTEINLLKVISAQLATSIQRRKLLKKIEFQAFHDSLTTLPNRILLDKNLQRFRAEAIASDAVFAVLFVDLDGFKRVNDEHGHAVGDQLLIDVVRRAERQLSERDFMARLGGDEFAIVTYPERVESFSYDQISVLTENLLSCLAADFDIQSNTVSISASIGVCLFPEHGSTNSELLSNADSAMYDAKSGGKNTVRVFDNKPADDPR